MTDSYSLKRNGSESCRFFYCERDNHGNIYTAVLAQRRSHYIDGFIFGRGQRGGHRHGLQPPP